MFVCQKILCACLLQMVANNHPPVSSPYMNTSTYIRGLTLAKEGESLATCVCLKISYTRACLLQMVPPVAKSCHV